MVSLAEVGVMTDDWRLIHEEDRGGAIRHAKSANHAIEQWAVGHQTCEIACDLHGWFTCATVQSLVIPLKTESSVPDHIGHRPCWRIG
jgi:hypothetical protein